MDSQANIDNSPSSSFSSVSSNDETSQTRTATLRNSYSSNDIDDSENESPQRIKSIDLASIEHTEQKAQNVIYSFRKCHSVVHLTSKGPRTNSIAKNKYRHTIQLPLTESNIKLSLSVQNTIFNVIKRDNYLCAYLKRFFNSCKVNTFNNNNKNKTQTKNYIFFSLFALRFFISFQSFILFCFFLQILFSFLFKIMLNITRDENTNITCFFETFVWFSFFVLHDIIYLYFFYYFLLHFRIVCINILDISTA